jgi:hypothetical protein
MYDMVGRQPLKFPAKAAGCGNRSLSSAACNSCKSRNGFRVQGLGFSLSSAACTSCNSRNGFRVQGLGFSLSSAACTSCKSRNGFKVQGLGFSLSSAAAPPKRKREKKRENAATAADNVGGIL